MTFLQHHCSCCARFATLDEIQRHNRDDEADGGSPRDRRTLCSRKRRDEDVLENSEQLNADPLQPASRPRSSLQVAFACPTLPAYQTRPERTPNTHTNSIRLTTSREVNEARLPHTCSRPCAFEEKITGRTKPEKNPPHPKHTTKSTATKRPRATRDGMQNTSHRLARTRPLP